VEFADSVGKFCQKGYKITFTGHSQGAAVAALTAWEIRNRFAICDLSVFTFGAAPFSTESANLGFFALKPAVKVRAFVTKCFKNGQWATDSITERYHEFTGLGTPEYLHGKDDIMEFPDRHRKKLTHSLKVLCHFPDNYFDALQDALHNKAEYWLKQCPRRNRPLPLQGYTIIKEWQELRQGHKRLMIDDQEPEKPFGAALSLEDVRRVNPCVHTPTWSPLERYGPGQRPAFPTPPIKSTL